MPILNKLFGKKSVAKNGKIEPEKKPAPAGIGKTEVKNKPSDFKPGGVLLSAITTEKAMAAQGLNRYVFKVAPKANKIEIAKTIGKNYNVKVMAVNIINIPRKARQVGKTKGFKSGYKKTVVTLAKGQTIEIK